ncbi:MAG: NINE protein [Planctomycetota bacterium]
MVYYFVISGDGQRYGPADIDALVQWAREGRLIGETMLLERGTERQIRADSITAINVALQRLAGVQPQASIDREPTVSREAPTMSMSPRPMRPPPPPPSPPPLAPLAGQQSAFSSRGRVIAGLLGIFLGGLGVHRFYLGYTGIGLLMLLVSILTGKLTGGVGCSIVHVWGAIEGVIILCGGFKDTDGRPLRD